MNEDPDSLRKRKTRMLRRAEIPELVRERQVRLDRRASALRDNLKRRKRRGSGPAAGESGSDDSEE